MANMGVYIVVFYLTCLVSTFFASSVRYHRIVKRFPSEIIHNDCYYLDPKEFKWNQKMNYKIKFDDDFRMNNEVNIKIDNKNDSHLSIINIKDKSVKMNIKNKDYKDLTVKAGKEKKNEVKDLKKSNSKNIKENI